MYNMVYTAPVHAQIQMETGNPVIQNFYRMNVYGNCWGNRIFMEISIGTIICHRKRVLAPKIDARVPPLPYTPLKISMYQK